MSIFDKKSKQINGPINVVRLEGFINNVKKVIYIFMNYSVSIYLQSECENIYSQDIQYYLAKSFSNLSTDSDKINKMYDFFIEYLPHTSLIQENKLENTNTDKNENNVDNTDTTNGTNKYYTSNINDSNTNTNIDRRLIYLYQVGKLFKKLFVVDSKKNNVRLSEYFKNIRLHYIDMDDIFSVNNINSYFDMIERELYIMEEHNYMNLYSLHNCGRYVYRIIEYYQKIDNSINSIITNDHIQSESLHGGKSDKTIYGKNLDKTDKLKKFIDKIYNIYKNDKIKMIMRDQIKILQEQISELLRKCKTYHESIIQYHSMINNQQDKLIIEPNSINEYIYGYELSAITNRNIITYLLNTYIIIMEMHTYYLSKFRDIFFLKRFLDKEYIVNAISYINAIHSHIYIEILVKYFDFKITHFAYSKINDLDKLTQDVKNRNVLEMGELFYPSIISQCSDITHFPKNFS